jgi:hypothetical protein
MTFRPPRARSAAPIGRFALPVSGAVATLYPPTGAEDLLLAEHEVEDPALALGLAQRLAEADPAVDWAGLPVPDIDTLIVRLRQALIGDRVVAEVVCGNAGCAQRVDISFSIGAYLTHHRPRPRIGRGRKWSLVPSTEHPGWYVLRLSDAETVSFRLPTLADQFAVFGLRDGTSGLAARCIRPHDLPGRMRARAEAAMAALAPPLVGPLQGHCPHCQTPIAARFEARLYCLQELRERARFIYDDIDVLAERYHWSERAILTLPHARRVSYVERARQTRFA